MLRRLRYTVPSIAIRKLYTTAVLPSLDYCDVVWSGCTRRAAKNLEVVQNNAARAITGAPYRSSATTLRKELGWQTLEKRREFHTTTWVYRCLKPDLTPPYLHNLFTPIQKRHQHGTRLSRSGVAVPRANTSLMMRSFQYRGAVVWNSLPDEVRSSNRKRSFETALKVYSM